jgi:hypothetical protein
MTLMSPQVPPRRKKNIHFGTDPAVALQVVTYRSRYAHLTPMGPDRLASAHFERNDITIICETVH